MRLWATIRLWAKYTLHHIHSMNSLRLFAYVSLYMLDIIYIISEDQCVIYVFNGPNHCVKVQNSRSAN